MKKTLLILGIAITVLGVLSLILGAFSFFAYRSVLDGSPSMYQRRKGRGIVFTATGTVLLVTGAVLMVVRKGLR